MANVILTAHILTAAPLANDTFPEHHENMGVGVIHGEEVTLRSDIVEAVFGG